MTEDSPRPGAGAVSRRGFLGAAAGAAASVSLLPAARAQQPPAAPPRLLRFSDHEPLGGMRTRFLKDVVFPAIERESNHRLKIEDHWDGEIAAAYDALGAVGGVGGPGAADMATVVPEYTAEALPLHQIFKSFPKGPAGAGQVAFFRRVYSQVPALSDELGRNGIVPVFFGTGYPVAFYSAAPMAGLEGLAGGRWRSASFWHLDFLRNAGATPVTMPWGPEVPAALKAGTLDGLMVNVDSGYLLKVHEPAPHVLVSQDLWLGHLYLLAMNRQVWDGLAPEDRDAIRRAADASYPALGTVMRQSFDAQLEALRAAGATVRVLGPDEVDRLASVSRYREVQAAWAEDQRRKGVADAGPTLATVARIMDEAVP